MQRGNKIREDLRKEFQAEGISLGYTSNRKYARVAGSQRAWHGDKVGEGVRARVDKPVSIA